MTKKGHNSLSVDLEKFIKRIETIREEKSVLSSDEKDIFAEAKANGYDTKVMREMLKLRKMELDEREEWEALRETYLNALSELM